MFPATFIMIVLPILIFVLSIVIFLATRKKKD